MIPYMSFALLSIHRARLPVPRYVRLWATSGRGGKPGRGETVARRSAERGLFVQRGESNALDDITLDTGTADGRDSRLQTAVFPHGVRLRPLPEEPRRVPRVRPRCLAQTGQRGPHQRRDAHDGP